MENAPSNGTPIKARITLVGAGPGDPELLSLKGVEALRTADAVLYDALVSTDLLDYAPRSAVRVFVGKRAGNHAYKQEDINQLLVDFALKYGHVVRLKGGDPYVFGRGNEELRHAERHGIPVEVVAGVSSALGLADGHGISLAGDGTTGSFWVITGSTRSGQLADDVAIAAQNDITAVILMGVNNLAGIVDCYQREGKGKTPVAIIQNGSTPDERMLIAEVDTVLASAETQQVAAPAVIIIGSAVARRPQDIAAWAASASDAALLGHHGGS
ncbi:uroporphyrinogen-III C-methyltransferase [Parapedobacter pyrenivorans]|uniref:uroporphyrinogen-III C-methyltransferase n=1 Tax=Parapedobacter pyrenivorans TaxID=1305674 RepID=A0A917HD32_9SPHI|nr:uroporphyrinogen-III C-methyltransferase [Parapedobacter pyrenivorans]GGG75016.1 uroporphyrinogen-III C-methyltransferase [Parapedobacter pyrenivorans]